MSRHFTKDMAVEILELENPCETSKWYWNFPSECFQRENRTTFSEVPFIPEIVQWNEPKACVPFTSQFSEFLGKCKMPKLKANAKDSVLARTTYNKARNQVVKLITDAKSIYLKERIVENKNNTRKLWKLLKQ